jgi:hypothetical protein
MCNCLLAATVFVIICGLALAVAFPLFSVLGVLG